MSDNRLTRIIAAAFEAAERSRAKKGMAPRPVPISKRRDGQRWIGPRRYRVTVWFRPWEYLDLFEEMRREEFTGSVGAFVIHRATGGKRRKARGRAVAHG